MITFQLELLQFALKLARVHAEVEQRSDKHVSGDAADEVEVENFHLKYTVLASGLPHQFKTIARDS